MKRQSGILFPIFSLPSRYGIGCISKEAYDFVDFLNKSGQSIWQILPIGPTGFGDSPYQPFSAFAGNPYFISLEDLIKEGLLKKEECDSLNFGNDIEKVDYGALYESRFTALKIAFDRFKEKLSADSDEAEKEKEEYNAFVSKQKYWLDDYALFMAIKKQQGGISWLDWEAPLKKRNAAAIAKARKECAGEYEFICFQQFKFMQQWEKFHKYAESENVKIVGDMPFYVSLDSADAWAHPEVFKMDKNLTPTEIAGCAPDVFSATGQRWGNPLYNWKKLASDGYKWWMDRIRRNYEFYDVIRIDHFHGFAQYYAIPYEDETALNGKLYKGPGMAFFNELKRQLGDVPMIAEDLGTITPEKEKLLEDSGLPGMKILQFAFTSWNSCYVTHRHVKNCVVYTGTHDNTTSRAWIEEITDSERDHVRRYINSRNSDYGAFVWDFIREAYRSVADLCVIPLQDYLVKGTEARINSPGTATGNWQWRLLPDFLSDELAHSIKELAELYGRIPEKDA